MARFIPSLIVIGVVAIAACVSNPVTQPPAPTQADCQITRVVDGDTIDMACYGEGRFRARLTGYDTPETYGPHCSAEARLGQAATDRLRGMVQASQRVEAELGGYDRYDRRLVQLSLDGRDVGATLIGEGLAVRYDGGRRINWCA